MDKQQHEAHLALAKKVYQLINANSDINANGLYECVADGRWGTVEQVIETCEEIANLKDSECSELEAVLKDAALRVLEITEEVA